MTGAQVAVAQIFNGALNDMGATQVRSNMHAATSVTDLGVSSVGLATQTAAHTQTMNNVAGIEAMAGAGGIGSMDASAISVLDRVLANRVWVGGFGVWQDQDSRDGYSGYKYKSGGFIVGYDRLFGNFMVGGSFAYGKGSNDIDFLVSNDSDIKTYSFDLYAKYYHSSGFMNTLFGGYTRVKNEYKQNLSVYNNGGQTWLGKNADYDTDVWSIGDTIGYRFNLNNCFSITPSIGLIYSEARTSDYNTWGGYNTRVSTDKVKSLVMPIQLEVGYLARINECSTFQFTVNGGFRHDFKNDAPTGTTYIPGVDVASGNAFEYGIPVIGMTPSNNIWNVGAGMKYTTGRFEVFAKYDFDTRSGYKGHKVLGGIGVRF